MYLACAWGTCYLIYMKFRSTYDGHHDSFQVLYLLVPAAILAILVNHSRTPLEILWTFSIYLESVAILPQLFMITVKNHIKRPYFNHFFFHHQGSTHFFCIKTGEAETITSHYLFAQGLYRGLYILNWIYRYSNEGRVEWIAVISGIVQTVLYCDFFYLYGTMLITNAQKVQILSIFSLFLRVF